MANGIGLNIRAPKSTSCTADQKRRNSDVCIRRKQSLCPSNAPAFEIYARRTQKLGPRITFSQRPGDYGGGSPICVQISRVARTVHTVTCRANPSRLSRAAIKEIKRLLSLPFPLPSLSPFSTRSAV